MVNLTRLKPFKVLVLGDFLLDTYTTGKVRRISPEAPVPVMEVLRHEARPGGAGNVALNLHALGGEVYCMGRIGSDVSGEQLKELLSSLHLSFVVEKNYPTPVKNRLIADAQQLMRIDTETISWLPSDLEEQALKQIEKIIPNMQVVAISDYGKGFVTNNLIRKTIAFAKEAGIPVIVDPKGTDFTKYKGASILKPNLSEAYASVKRSMCTSLDEVAEIIFAQTSVDRLLITRSEAGMSLFEAKGKREDFPVVSKEVTDVTGAGDTVLAVLSASLANGLDLPTCVKMSNVAAGVAVERLGCVQVTLSEIAQRILKHETHTKILHIDYSYHLEQAMRGKGYSLLLLSKKQPLTLQFFKQMRALSSQTKIIAYIEDATLEDEFVDVLSTFQEIETIILQKETLQHWCSIVQPSEILSWKKQQLVQAKRTLHDLLNRQNLSKK